MVTSWSLELPGYSLVDVSGYDLDPDLNRSERPTSRCGEVSVTIPCFPCSLILFFKISNNFQHLMASALTTASLSMAQLQQEQSFLQERISPYGMTPPSENDERDMRLRPVGCPLHYTFWALVSLFSQDFFERAIRPISPSPGICARLVKLWPWQLHGKSLSHGHEWEDNVNYRALSHR